MYKAEVEWEEGSSRADGVCSGRIDRPRQLSLSPKRTLSSDSGTAGWKINIVQVQDSHNSEF